MKNTNEQLVIVASLIARLARNQEALADAVDQLTSGGGPTSMRLMEVRGEAKEIQAALSALEAP